MPLAEMKLCSPTPTQQMREARIENFFFRVENLTLNLMNPANVYDWNSVSRNRTPEG